MKAIDVCCGAGGLSRGLLDAGIDVVLGVDIWASALKVYRRNLGLPTLRADLAEMPKLPCVDLICGGPPCQDFSQAGKREEGAMAGLTVAFATIVSKQKPKYFVYENVPDARKATTYLEAKNILRSVSYGMSEVVLDASLYGVPQKRKRIALVGVLGGKDEDLQDMLIAGASERAVTLREYCNSQGMPLAIEYYYHNSRYGDRQAIRGMDEPAPTLRSSSGHPLPLDYHTHPQDATTDLNRVRALTLREACLVQTFPPAWDWCDHKLSDCWTMLANAVPPRLGQHVGRVLAGLEGHLIGDPNAVADARMRVRDTKVGDPLVRPSRMLAPMPAEAGDLEDELVAHTCLPA